MAGLLDGVLPWVYSRGNALNRGVTGLLSDPLGSMEQSAGLLADYRREDDRLNALVFADPKTVSKPERDEALNQLANRMLSGPLSFAPAGILAGPSAKTANKMALTQAQTLEKQGVKPEVIWQQTGWGKGPDGKWRFEIDDSVSKPLQRTWGEGEDLKAGNSTTTKRQRALAHPGLSAAYPETKQIGVTLRAGSGKDAAYFDGAFGPSINASADPRYGYKPDRSVMLHELQHYVQDREKLSPGGAPGDSLTKAAAQKFYNNAKDQFSGTPQQLMDMAQHRAYMNLAGEAEARLVQARMNLTPAERLAQFPWEPTYFQKATNSPLNALIVP